MTTPEQILRHVFDIRRATESIIKLLPLDPAPALAPDSAPLPEPPPGGALRSARAVPTEVLTVQGIAELLPCFKVGGRFATRETVEVYLLDITLEQALALALLAPATCGRHLDGYAPAGPLLVELHCQGFLQDFHG